MPVLKKIIGIVLLLISLILLMALIYLFDDVMDCFRDVSRMFSDEMSSYDRGYAFGQFLIYTAMILLVFFLPKFGMRLLRSK